MGHDAPRGAARPGPPLTSISGDDLGRRSRGRTALRPAALPPGRQPSHSEAAGTAAPAAGPRERTVRERHCEPWLRLSRLSQVKDAISGGRTRAAAHRPHRSLCSRPRARALTGPSPQGATREAAILPHLVCAFPRCVLGFRRSGRESRHTVLMLTRSMSDTGQTAGSRLAAGRRAEPGQALPAPHTEKFTSPLTCWSCLAP